MNTSASPAATPEPAPPAPPIQFEPQPSEPAPEARRQRFYEAEVKPILAAHERVNRAAVERAEQRIGELFASYRRGVEPFAEDLTSFGTRLRVMARMPGDWWYEDERINRMLSGRFERHLFSEQQLNEDLNAVLLAFREDLEANRNRLLSQVQAAVHTSDLPELPVPDFTAYDQQVRRDLVTLAEDRGRTSVYQGIATLVASEAAFLAAAKLATLSTATLVGGTGAAAGGATVAGAGTGGAGGAWAGPVGVGVGLVAGLLIGTGIDWWMTERFRTRLVDEMNGYLQQLETRLLEGGEQEDGLRVALNRFIDDLNTAETVLLHKTLVEAGP